MAAAIVVESLSKRYRLPGTEQSSYPTIRDEVVRLLTWPLRRLRGQVRRAEEFWALKDVSFEIQPGEAVGVLGFNGAGKSTLLKVISRITRPTSGRVRLRGRVGSLLEVGTGFNPQLTGRENVYLNGAILGMRRAEIRRKFDEIVAFAEVERFLDLPVKRYSSGMYMRLAFAVAAHLDPEILLVDEVLAVGDAAFQRKCLGKMEAVAGQGRTVFFVSHNMEAVRQLTRRALFLEGGRLIADGPAEEVVRTYSARGQERTDNVYTDLDRHRRFHGLTRDVELVGLELESAAVPPVIRREEELAVRLRLRGRRDVGELRISITIFQENGAPVGSIFSEEPLAVGEGETAEIRLVLGELGLTPGRYHCGVAVGRREGRGREEEYDIVLDVLHFQVVAETGEVEGGPAWRSGWGPVRFGRPVVTRMG